MTIEHTTYATAANSNPIATWRSSRRLVAGFKIGSEFAAAVRFMSVSVPIGDEPSTGRNIGAELGISRSVIHLFRAAVILPQTKS